jgi:hypothetical protein
VVGAAIGIVEDYGVGEGVVEGAEPGGFEGLGFDDEAIGFEELLDAGRGVDGGR